MRKKSGAQIYEQWHKLYYLAVAREMKVKGFDYNAPLHASNGWFEYCKTDRSSFMSKLHKSSEIVKRYVANIYMLHGIEDSNLIPTELSNQIYDTPVSTFDYMNCK